MLVGSRTRIEKGRIETIPPFFVFVIGVVGVLGVFGEKIGVLRVIGVLR